MLEWTVAALGVIEMELAVTHPWDLTTDEAFALQSRLASKVVLETGFDPLSVRTVAGVDVGFHGSTARAAVVVLNYPGLEPIATSYAEVPVTFPYVPGLLAFREGPSVLAALDKLSIWPDLFVFDAHGLAHHRRMGLACHMGVVLDWPSIGCAKSRLVGTHQEPGQRAGDWVPLFDKGQEIGAVVRTRTGVKPLYVSPGHRVDLPSAIQMVLACVRGYRLPETTRRAHKAASRPHPDSTDTLHPDSTDTLHPDSTDTLHPDSTDTPHPDSTAC